MFVSALFVFSAADFVTQNPFGNDRNDPVGRVIEDVLGLTFCFVLSLQMYLNMQLQLGLKRFSELYSSVPLPGVPTDGNSMHGREFQEVAIWGLLLRRTYNKRTSCCYAVTNFVATDHLKVVFVLTV